jgi:TRAP-type C4-dicarboxylate transport system substrate-binding protein
MELTKRQLLAGAAATTIAMPNIATAQTAIDLTVGAPFPTSVPWIQPIEAFFVPEVNRRLAAAGGKFRINWKEAYGGTLYRANAALSAVATGIVDIGTVFSLWEASKMPLTNFSLAVPFSTENCVAIGEAAHETFDQIPALQTEWDRNGLVWLGSSMVDTYHLCLKQPIAKFSDLAGRKISAAGAVGLWIRDTGATTLQGQIATFYTDVQTGVADGAMVPASGIASSKIYEVAPNIALVGFGGQHHGALSINKARMGRLPQEVQDVLLAVGREFSAKVGENVLARSAASMATVRQIGPSQPTPVQFIDFSGDARSDYARSMRDLVTEWTAPLEQRGLPARQAVRTYMAALRKRGEKPLRDWDIVG